MNLSIETEMEILSRYIRGRVKGAQRDAMMGLVMRQDTAANEANALAVVAAIFARFALCRKSGSAGDFTS